jgi:ceramide glucosyltransferase
MKEKITISVFMFAAFALVLSIVRAVGLGGVIGGIGMALLAFIVLWHRTLSRAVKPMAAKPHGPRSYPSVSVIRPVRGKDVGAAENFAAALDTGYPGEVETLFVFDDELDEGLPVAREVVAAHAAAGRRGTARVLVAGAPPAGRTGKLNAMVVGQRFAVGELVAFGDSDTRPDRKVLRGVVDALLSSPRAGSAFAPNLVHEAPRAAGDVVYAIMQNALYAPLAAWFAGEARELPFIMGQLMVFRRAALLAIGGVESVTGQLVDDMAIGRRLHEAGYTNVLGRAPLHIATGGMTLRQFLPVFRRWMMFSRNGLPLSFTWRQWLQGVAFFLALAAMVIGFATGHPWAALISALAIVTQSASLLALNSENGAAPIPLRWAFMPVVFFLLAPFVLAQNILRRRVEWRGRAYQLDGAAALAASSPVLVAREPARIVPARAAAAH